MWPEANTPWFTFQSDEDSFSVYSFRGTEAVCTPYEFVIELVSEDADIDLTGLLGTEACLTLRDRSSGGGGGGEDEGGDDGGDEEESVRYVHGIIRQMELVNIKQVEREKTFSHYRCHLVPKAYFLDQIMDHRIFQEKSVEDIIKDVLEEQGFSGDDYSFKLNGDSSEREYCVQYGETVLHFITRLCEEEGVYFYFEHSEEGHTMCFCDEAGGPTIEGENELRFYPGSGMLADTAVVARVNLHERINSNAAAYREWNFTTPKQDLTVEEEDGDAPLPDGMTLEQYRYPHIYDEKGDGETYVKTQVLRQQTFAKWIEAEGDVCRFVPSYTFSITEHPRGDINASWWVVSVLHEGEQPGVLEHEAPSDRGMEYKASIVAIPEDTRFVPELNHPKQRIVGQQTALVTGPDGEEIYTDEYGRVKVQFHWDREGEMDEKTSCWLRVSQGWAGGTYGMMALPRIGHEVIVSFMEGDPDRPVVTGRVYHELNKPPYELPDEKTKTVLKTMSTPGEEGEERGFNEFRIEDKKDEEEIYIHAEKDVNIYVNNDWKEYILNDWHQTVEQHSYTVIKGEEHRIVEDVRKIELKDEDHLIVHGDSHTEYETKWLVKIGEELHFSSDDTIVIEAENDITIKASDSFIRLTPSGIVIQGSSVKINEGGSPGSGTDAEPEEPEEAVLIDEAGKPQQPEKVEREKQEKDSASGGGGSAGGAGSKGFAAENMPVSGDNNSPGTGVSDAVSTNGSDVIKDASNPVTDHRELIDKSPTLSQQVDNTKATVQYGQGTYYDSSKNIVVLDESRREDPNAAVRSLSHEMGHVYGPDRDLSSASNYVTSSLDREGASTLNNIRVRNEILEATGNATDIGISGNAGMHEQYIDIFNQMETGDLTEAQAYRKIGEIFGDNEYTYWQGERVTYGTYYTNGAKQMGLSND